MRADEVRDVFESVEAHPSPRFSEALLARLRADYLRADLDASRDSAHVTLEPILIDLLHEEPRVGHRRRPERPNRPWRQRRVAVAATAAAVIVAASVFVFTVSGDDLVVTPTQGPVSTTVPSLPLSALPDGLNGLPPIGAAPSTPKTGDLLASLPIPIWVYEDGRVLSARWTTYDDWTGILEQRLTPEGVELVRAEILALEPLRSPLGDLVDCRAGLGNYGYEDGGRLVCERPGDATSLYPDSPQYQRLSELQFGAPSWLPANAWADPEPKPYVPSTYQIRIHSTANAPTDASAMLAALPPDAGELLTVPTQCPVLGVMASPNTMCFKVSTEEARQVGTAVGITGPHGYEQAVRTQRGSYSIEFLPYLPHDAPVWCCGG
jgi:hypothetical protein